jgi:hypothetical protein
MLWEKESPSENLNQVKGIHRTCELWRAAHAESRDTYIKKDGKFQTTMAAAAQQQHA